MDLFAQDGEDLLVRQRAQTIRNVAFDNPGRISPGMRELLEGGMASSSWPKSVRVGAELNVVIGVQDQPDHLRKAAYRSRRAIRAVAFFRCAWRWRFSLLVATATVPSAKHQ
jgi:hypothetical protein